jgi:UDP-2-acetamido-2-deoxy-ribo-hexuluronate aminotransferase
MKLFCINNQNKLINKKVQKRFKVILRSGKFILGKNVMKIENQLKQQINSKHCITTSSGTDALLISLMAIGVKNGDEVITTAFTYIATVEVILRLGAKPVFADIKYSTGLIDENDVKKKITKNTKAIIAVSLFGNIPNFKKIKSFANDVFVIEDAAQSFGSSYQGNFSCNLSDIGCTSFYPTKNLSCYGDGGAIFTNSMKLAKKINLIRNHGEKEKYNSSILGICGRLDEIQAAVLIEKLKIFKSEVKKRIYFGKKMREILKNLSLSQEKNVKIAYNTFPILVKNRKKILKKLKKNKIEYATYYPIPIHKQKIISSNTNINLKNTERLCKNIINLPVHPYINEKYLLKIKNIFEN